MSVRAASAPPWPEHGEDDAIVSAADAAMGPPQHVHQTALALLLQDRVEGAEAYLRAGYHCSTCALDRMCALNNLGLCGVHSRRSREGARLLAHALASLPEPSSSAAGEANASHLLGRIQLQLNLCEALMLQGDPTWALKSAIEAMRVADLAEAQLGPHANGGGSGRGGIRRRKGSGGGAIHAPASPRLFMARWLSPAVAHSSRPPSEHDATSATSVGQVALVGTVSVSQGRSLAWLWIALAHEAIGAHQKALECYRKAMASAELHNEAILASIAQLRSRMFASVTSEGRPSLHPPPFCDAVSPTPDLSRSHVEAELSAAAKLSIPTKRVRELAAGGGGRSLQTGQGVPQATASSSSPTRTLPAARTGGSLAHPASGGHCVRSCARARACSANSSLMRSATTAMPTATPTAAHAADAAAAAEPRPYTASSGALSIYTLSRAERVHQQLRRDDLHQTVLQSAAKQRAYDARLAARERLATARVPKLHTATRSHRFGDATPTALATATAAKAGASVAPGKGRPDEFERARRVTAAARRALHRDLRAQLDRILAGLRRAASVGAAGSGGGGVRTATQVPGAISSLRRDLEALRARELSDGSQERARSLATALWVLNQGTLTDVPEALRLLHWLRENWEAVAGRPTEIEYEDYATGDADYATATATATAWVGVATHEGAGNDCERLSESQSSAFRASHRRTPSHPVMASANALQAAHSSSPHRPCASARTSPSRARQSAGPVASPLPSASGAAELSVAEWSGVAPRCPHRADAAALSGGAASPRSSQATPRASNGASNGASYALIRHFGAPPADAPANPESFCFGDVLLHPPPPAPDQPAVATTPPLAAARASSSSTTQSRHAQPRSARGSANVDADDLAESPTTSTHAPPTHAPPTHSPMPRARSARASSPAADSPDAALRAARKAKAKLEQDAKRSSEDALAAALEERTKQAAARRAAEGARHAIHEAALRAAQAHEGRHAAEQSARIAERAATLHQAGVYEKEVALRALLEREAAYRTEQLRALRHKAVQDRATRLVEMRDVRRKIAAEMKAQFRVAPSVGRPGRSAGVRVKLRPFRYAIDGDSSYGSAALHICLVPRDDEQRLSGPPTGASTDAGAQPHLTARTPRTEPLEQLIEIGLALPIVTDARALTELLTAVYKAFALFASASYSTTAAAVPASSFGEAPPPLPGYAIDPESRVLSGGGCMPTKDLDLFLVALGEAHLTEGSRRALVRSLSRFTATPFPNLVGLVLHHMAAPYAIAPRALSHDEASHLAALLLPAPSVGQQRVPEIATSDALALRGQGLLVVANADVLTTPLGVGPLAALYSAFALFDENADGTVPWRDIDLVLGSLEHHLTQPELSRQTLQGLRAQSGGADGDRLAFGEWVGLMASTRPFDGAVAGAGGLTAQPPAQQAASLTPAATAGTVQTAPLAHGLVEEMPPRRGLREAFELFADPVIYSLALDQLPLVLEQCGIRRSLEELAAVHTAFGLAAADCIDLDCLTRIVIALRAELSRGL